MSSKRQDSPQELAGKLLEGSRRAASRLISLVEDGSAGIDEAMKRIYPHTGRAMLVGITGAGGSGKSSLIDHLIEGFRKRDLRVVVVAVDPSSPFSGGALLGDRIRFQRHAMDEGVYARSMGSRGYLGGLARTTTDVCRILEAMGSDVVIIETLGAGQDEIDIIHVAQTCLLVLTPGMGDDIQVMKAGIMEIAHLIVLNKSDLDGAGACLRSLEAAVHDAHGAAGENAWVPRVIPTVAWGRRAREISGMDELVDAIQAHQVHLRTSRALEEVQNRRIEQELSLIFRDALEKLVFSGLKGTGRKRECIRAIREGRSDPYSVVDEVLKETLTWNPKRR